MAKKKDSLDFDPLELENLNSRLYEINKLKTKYHLNINELIALNDKISLELSLYSDYDNTINNLKEEVATSFNKAYKLALKISNYRKDKAKILEEKLIEQCIDLNLENIDFKVNFSLNNNLDFLNSDLLLDNGIDTVDFMITLNKGEPLKSLYKVASGGELSRIMLALKVIYLQQNDLSFMVFDEIDSGISGQTAIKIAQKMYNIGKKVQLLAITHLPQVAAYADTELLISKVIVDNRTKTQIKELDYSQRVNEIAMMLAGVGLNNAMIEAAKALLDEKNKTVIQS